MRTGEGTQFFDAELRSPRSFTSLLDTNRPPISISLSFWPLEQERLPMPRRTVRIGKLLPRGAWQRVGKSSNKIEGILLLPNGHEVIATLTVTCNRFTEVQRKGKPRILLAY